METLREKIEKAFAIRQMPSKVVEPEALLQLDSDVEEALWFAGRARHEITWKDWEKHSAAIFFLSRDAFAYYLPSVLALTSEHPDQWLMAADGLFNYLDRSPCVEGWDDHFTRRFLGLRSAEYEVIKEWLLFMSGFDTYRGYGIAATGPGDTFGRAFDTVTLLQKETARRRLQSCGEESKDG